MGEIRVKLINATDEKHRRPLMIIHDRRARIHYDAIALRALRFVINVFSVILSDRAGIVSKGDPR